MTGEGVDVRHQLGPVRPGRGPADALLEGDLDAGGLALEGPQDQFFILHQRCGKRSFSRARRAEKHQIFFPDHTVYLLFVVCSKIRYR